MSCPVREKSSSAASSSSPSSSSSSSSPSASPPSSSSAPPSECPMSAGTRYKNPQQYNVYSQPIDPTNQMPQQANNVPAPGQQINLPTERVSSTIPKGGTNEGTWQYPSPQMFWNALVRKGKTEGASENEMESVIAVHNNMNEATWMQVLAWEKLHDNNDGPKDGREAKLLRFIGRPDELSPKARLKMLFGHIAPFDRHDWVVDRGGKEVKYIIDYYHDESAIQNDQRPAHLKDFSSMKSIKVDVRPAFESLESIVDRVLRMPMRMMMVEYGWKKNDIGLVYKPPPFFQSTQMSNAENMKFQRISQNWKDIKTKCESSKLLMKNCQTDEECSAASIALQRCTASVVCPSVVLEFDECVKKGDEAKLGVAYNSIVKCLEMFEIDTRAAKK